MWRDTARFQQGFLHGRGGNWRGCAGGVQSQTLHPPERQPIRHERQNHQTAAPVCTGAPA
jgi:hypothetical protein